MLSRSESGMPLLGKSVLLVCSPLKVEALAPGLESLGAKVLTFQAISVRPIENPEELDAALASLASYHWVIFTSAHAVLFFARRMNERGVPLERLERVEICAVGPATARKAEECGFRISLLPQDFVAEGVVEALVRRLGGMQNLAGQRILIPRAKEAREVLPVNLTAAGAHVDIAVCYETVQAKVDPATLARVREHPPDLILFTSSSNAAHLASMVGASEFRRMLDRATVAALGPVTAKTVESFGKRPEILPAQNTIPSLLESIRAHYERC